MGVVGQSLNRICRGSTGFGVFARFTHEGRIFASACAFWGAFGLFAPKVAASLPATLSLLRGWP